MTLAPVISIDGPSASGKGTVAARVAEALGLHYLESGALYRLVALASHRARVSQDDEPGLAKLAAELPVRFLSDRILLDEEDVADHLRSEEIGNRASALARLPAVRAALLARQRAFRAPPGLVADGRDMGTVVFTDSVLKVFLTASVEVRAERRYKQLNEKGNHANLTSLYRDLSERDERDVTRAAAPLVPAIDAVRIDTSDLSVDEVVARVLQLARERL
ncbi:MAG: (d)CMP kinase [Betaproteobacteria bacterium]|nr:(d)CMP kinase [Betaproteobacteria bacterium]